MGLLFLAFLLLVSISVAASFWTIETQKKDALVINLAGRQRMLIQQMTKDALQIEKEGQRAHVLALQEGIRPFDQTLWAFINGGQAPYLPDYAVDIPATQNPDILAALDQVQRTWDAFRGHLDLIMTTAPDSPDFITAFQAVEQLSPELVQQADEVVRLYETTATQKVTRLRWIQVAFFASILALLAIDSLLVQKFVVGPLHTLGSVAKRIGQGNLDTQVETTGPREIALLAHSFDTMRAQLKASQEEQLAWAEELETRVAQRTRELAALHEVSCEISSRLDINHVLRSVADKTQELLGCQVAVLCLLEGGPKLRAFSGPPEALCKNQAAAQHRPAKEPMLPYGTDDCAGSCGILAASYRVSHLEAPLRAGQDTIGVLCVGSPKAEFFSDEAADLLAKLAGSAAVALENARLYEQAERVAMLEERQRIAAEMHDGLAQTLTYLRLKTEQATEFVETGRSEEAMGELQRVDEAIVQASWEARRSITNLQKGPQSPQALQDRLAEMVDQFTRDGGPPTELVVRSQATLLLTPGQTEQVLRVVSESLLNVRHHAQAGGIIVCLEQQDGEATVTVEDDGRGFDPKAPPMDDNAHFGLSIMRARAARIGGQLAIHSALGQGTRVILAWSVDDK
jgi:two-component system nitrate/nitrite sensor histidine kinase NarX